MTKTLAAAATECVAWRQRKGAVRDGFRKLKKAELGSAFLLAAGPARQVAVHQGSRAGRSRADLAEFEGEDYVLFSRAFSPAYYDQVVSLCLAAGFHPEIKHEARHWLTVLACVSPGMGITLVPQSLSTSGFSGLAFLELGDGPVRSVVRGAWLQSDDSEPAL